MQKRQINKKLRLRKDTVRTLGADAMGQVRGGLTDEVACFRTKDQRCVEASLLPGGCADPTAFETMGCTYTCNLACTNTCTIFNC